jgi:hypothetical protein
MVRSANAVGSHRFPDPDQLDVQMPSIGNSMQGLDGLEYMIAQK